VKRLLLALLAAAPLVANAQQWSWKEHAYPEDHFAVEFNGPVNIRPMRLEGEAGIERGTQYMLEGKTQIYLVGASLNKLSVDLDKGAEQSFTALQCRKVVADSPFDAPWGKGRELRGAGCIDGKYSALARYQQSGLWFYQVLALYRGDDGDASSARYFLQSFRVTR
jgi:hypothetical protein